MAVTAEAMTNGYPLAAIIGKRDIMDAAQGTFISSTFFTERIGLAAALKSVELYQKNRVWEKQIEYGNQVRNGWEKSAKANGIDIEIGGIPSLIHFIIKGQESPLVYQTYFTQEMLRRGYIAGTSFYASYAHSKGIIEEYLQNVEDVFKGLADKMGDGKGVEKALEGPVCHGHFGRLN